MKGHVCLAKPTWNTWTEMHVYRTQNTVYMSESFNIQL